MHPWSPHGWKRVFHLNSLLGWGFYVRPYIYLKGAPTKGRKVQRAMLFFFEIVSYLYFEYVFLLKLPKVQSKLVLRPINISILTISISVVKLMLMLSRSTYNTSMSPCMYKYICLWICSVYPPPKMAVTNEGLGSGFPLKMELSWRLTAILGGEVVPMNMYIWLNEATLNYHINDSFTSDWHLSHLMASTVLLDWYDLRGQRCD